MARTIDLGLTQPRSGWSGCGVKPLAALAVAVVCGASPVGAQGPTPVTLRVGETVNVCIAKLVMCPVSAFSCDEPSIAVIENGPEGAVVRGVAPGSTLCGVFGNEKASHRVLRVRVLPSAPRP